MNDILYKIADDKRYEVEQLKEHLPLEKIINAIDIDKKHLFKKALSDKQNINIIAELKKGSPSKGIIKAQFDPEKTAQKYKEGGAVALSVLTEQKYFYGRYEYLKIVREKTQLPVLCKDFILDAYQIYHACYMGADAILLIVKLLTRQQLSNFIEIANNIGLDTLVEIHNQQELQIALGSGTEIIGVNNRNLNDFTVDLKIAESLAPLIPKSVIKVSESGIFNYSDIKFLKNAGYNNFLIGEALMKTDDPILLLESLRGLL